VANDKLAPRSKQPLRRQAQDAGHLRLYFFNQLIIRRDAEGGIPYKDIVCYELSR